MFIINYFKSEKIRIILLFEFMVCCILLFAIFQAYSVKIDQANQKLAEISIQGEAYKDLHTRYIVLDEKINGYKAEGMDVSAYLTKLDTLKKYLSSGNFDGFTSLIKTVEIDVDCDHQTFLDNRAKKVVTPPVAVVENGKISGTIKSGNTVLAGVKIALKQGKTEITATTSDNQGKYALEAKVGVYTLTATKQSHSDYTKANISIKSDKPVSLDINLTANTSPPPYNKIIPPSPPPPPPSDSPTPTPTSTYTPTPTPPPSGCPGSYSEALLCLINKHRQDNGKGVLAMDSVLNQVATNHSKWMQETGIISHYEGNISPWDRCVTAGTTCGGENIAWNYPDAGSVFNAWKASPGHNMNMLGNFRKIGIGLAGVYHTNVFQW